MSASHPRIIIIGAGSRGNAYARALHGHDPRSVVAVAEPHPAKRRALGQRYIWGPKNSDTADEGEEFQGWEEFVAYEQEKRTRGEGSLVDAAWVCTLDETHVVIVKALAGLGLHVLCEKPLATGLEGVLEVRRALMESWKIAGEGVVNGDGMAEVVKPTTIFGICHVLRYSPHNMLLRDLVLKQRVIGDVLSVEHTEPVGWWHFSHSYVRGNWRKESTTAPSLLTKSCHDIDFLLWLLSSPPTGVNAPPHLPSKLTSSGSLSYFKRSRKPAAAGDATNCLSCPIERDCLYSARKIYVEKRLKNGNTGWPVKIVNPEIEDIYRNKGEGAAEEQLLRDLAEDYDAETTSMQVDSRPWFGRCVWESDNDVCDDQTVTITWGDALPTTGLENHCAKTATFHMVAFTEAICERRGRIYGTAGEISYDSSTIRVHDFATGQTEVYTPPKPGGGHGGGDDSLAQQFYKSVDAVKNHGVPVEQAQIEHLGCTLDEVVRSHAMVFAAEEARREEKVVDWKEWWAREVESS